MWVINILLVLNTCRAQTIQETLSSMPLVEVKSLFDLDTLKKLNSQSEVQFCAYFESKYNERIYFDRLNNIYLYPSVINYNGELEMTTMSIYDETGFLFAYWSFATEIKNFHVIEYYYIDDKSGHTFKRKLFLGCLKDQKCNWRKFSKELFSGLTMSKSGIEFDLMIKEIKMKYENYR